MVIFLDTYALIEIDKGNPAYERYALKPEIAATTVLNLMEIHFKYLKEFGTGEADQIHKIVKPLVVPIDDSIIKEGNKFKLLHLRKRLSFADCIGYAAAKKYGAKFVTGDYMFKGMDNVEFVQ